MTIVRTATRDDIDEVASLTARVFGNDDDRDSIFQLTRMAMQECPFIPPEQCWLAEVDGRIVAKWQILDFVMRTGGSDIRMGGVQAVVAEPDENHKGYPRQIAIEAIPQIAKAGFDVLLGFAQRGAFYRKIGAFPLMAEYEFELDAYQIPTVGDDPFHEWTDAELPQLIDFYNRANAERSASMVRTEGHWPWMVRKPPVVHMCDAGYIGVRHNEDDLEIREVAGLGARFHAAALRKLGKLAREQGVRKIRGAVPADHPLVDAALPYGANVQSLYTKKSGSFALILDPLGLLQKVRGDLEQRLSDSTHAGVHVELCVRCDGIEQHLDLNTGGQRVHKIEITLSRSGIMQMIFGYRPAAALLADEYMEAAEKSDCAADRLPDEESLALLGTLFPHRHPFMWQPDRY